MGRNVGLPEGWAEIDMKCARDCSPTKPDLTLAGLPLQCQAVFEVQNHSLGGRFPKSAFALWQVRINNCICFAHFALIVIIMPHPTPIGMNSLYLPVKVCGHSAIAGRVGLTTINRILQRRAATGNLVPGKSMGAPQKTTLHEVLCSGWSNKIAP